MSAIENDIQIINLIRMRMVEELNNLFQFLEPFFFESNQKRFPECIEYFQKIYEAGTSLKKELEKLEQDLTKSNIEKINFSSYLAKVRHDLRNPITAMQGYAEISSEDFQKKPNEPLMSKLLEIIITVRKISSLIDEIRIIPGYTTSGLPILEIPQQIPAEEVLKKELITEEYRNFKEKFSVLIVDDIEENCHILERYLHNSGYMNTHNSYSAQEALNLLQNKKFDLVLLDIDMPGMNGIELLQRLKEDILQRRFMVLMITGSDTIENAIQCIKLGAEDILPKPFDVDMLRVRIGSCVEKKWFINKEDQYRDRLEVEKHRYEDLLNAIFPPSVVEELTVTGQVQARNYENVAVLFTDVVNFTQYCNTHELADIIKNIQEIAEICESATSKYKLQKIKTIGDGFLAIAGMLTKHKNPVLDCINCAEEIIARSVHLEAKWQLRAGIDYGTVIGGIVGHRQYLFDIWSDTVNTADRIQTLAEPGMLYLSKNAWDQVKEDCVGKYLGQRQVKGKVVEIFSYQKKRPKS